MAEPLDPSEVDATAPRPALGPALSARRVRSASRSRPESTQEVAVEDILLEAYVEEPEPVSRQPSQGTPLSPLTSKDLAAIEELLRGAPRPPPPAPLPPRPVHFTHSQHSQAFHPPHTSVPGAPFDTPSVAPVTFGSSPASEPVRAPFGIPAAWPAPAPEPPARSNRGILFAVGAVAAFVACAVSVKIIRPMAALHASSAATSAVSPTRAREPVPKAEPPAELQPVPARVAPITGMASPSSSAPAVPTVAVDALPKASVPPDMTLLTLPPYAAGHRVFLDKALLQKASSPIRLKCGEHTIKIGSSGKPRLVDLPCGREFTLP